MPGLHHLELWVQDFEVAESTLGWLFLRLGFPRKETWQAGASWQIGDLYLVLEAGPEVSGTHDRRRAGLNHLAFSVADRAEVEAIAAESKARGWILMFEDLHPYAGGAKHYAAYLQDQQGFEVEIVAATS